MFNSKETYATIAPRLISYMAIKLKSATLSAGLPDGSFSNQKSKFGLILEGLAMEDVGIFYGHLVHFLLFYFMDIWYSSW
jgi:hypothetical protein